MEVVRMWAVANAAQNKRLKSVQFAPSSRRYLAHVGDVSEVVYPQAEHPHRSVHYLERGDLHAADFDRFGCFTQIKSRDKDPRREWFEGVREDALNVGEVFGQRI